MPTSSQSAITLLPMTSIWASALSFLAATLLLDFYDISLPRGDSTGVAGAICAAAILILGPVPAVAVSLASAVIAHVARRRFESGGRLVLVLLSRLAALAAASALLWTTLSGGPEALLFVIVPAVFLVVELLAAQGAAALLTGRPFLRLVRGTLRSEASLMAAQWSASVLLLLTYGHMRQWALVPVVALLLLMRQSYALFLGVRETYRATVEVLIQAVESQDERRAGHSDRTALLARAIAMKIGLSATQVERISYAALLHDLGELAEAADEPISRRSSSSEVVRGVEFFEPIEPVLRVCDGIDEGAAANEDDLLAALIVALASDIDAEYHPQVAAAHRFSSLDLVAHRVTPALKARAVGAALRLGYRIPAVG